MSLGGTNHRWPLAVGFLLLAGCSTLPAGGPAWPEGEAAIQGTVVDETESSAVSALLERRPRDQYWWNLPRGEEPALHGGIYQDRRDSLGFDEFRALDPTEQLKRSEDARGRVRDGRDRNRARSSQNDYATAVGLCPYYPEAWLLYAETQIDQGNYVSGRYLLQGVERSLRFAPDEEEQRRLAGGMYFYDAVASYNLGDEERALDSVESSLLLDSTNSNARLLHARALVDLDRYDEARAELASFRFGHPYYAQAQAVRGVLEMKVGDLGKADRAFAEAWEYGLRSAIFENDRGRLRLLQDRPGDAVSHFEEAVELSPELMEARNNLAVALRRSGQEARAIQVLARALAINPHYAPAHFNLAELHRSRLDRLEGAELEQTAELALRHYDAALEEGYRREVVLERRAWISLRLGDAASAEEDLLALAGSPETSGRVLYLLARSKKEQGDLRIAEQLYRMALDQGYRSPAVHSDLGEVLLLRQDYQGARVELERALARDPSLVNTRVNLAQVLMELGDYEAAQTVLDRAAVLAPGDPAVETQQEELRRRRGRP